MASSPPMLLRGHPRFVAWGALALFVTAGSGCEWGYDLIDRDGASLGGAEAGDGDGDGDGDGGNGDGDADGGGNGDGDMSQGGRGDASGGMGGSTAGSGGDGSGGDGTGGESTGGETGMSECEMGEILCSGFEYPILNDWTRIDLAPMASSTLKRVTDPVSSGDEALQTYASDDSDFARVEYEFDTPIDSGWLSLRAYFYVPTSSTITDVIPILELNDADPDDINKLAFALDENDYITISATTGIAGSTSFGPSAFARDTWNCAVIRVEVTDPGSVEIELNGGINTGLMGGDTHPSGGFARARVGIDKPPSHGEFEIFFDDVTLAAEQLSCP